MGYGAKPEAIPADAAIDLPMDVLFGKPPKMHRDARSVAPTPWPRPDTTTIDLKQAALRKTGGGVHIVTAGTKQNGFAIG